MGIRTEDHLSAAGHGFTVEAVNVGHICGNIDAAVFVRGRKCEFMVILVDRSADRTETVVTVRQNIGDRELGQAGCPGGLDNTYIGNIMGGQAVEAQLQMLHIFILIMGLQDPVSDRAFCCLNRLRNTACQRTCFGSAFAKLHSVYDIDAVIIKLDHKSFSSFQMVSSILRIS